MKILDVLPKEAILSDLKSLDKKGVIEELVIPVAGIAGVNKEEIVRVLMERERLGSTGIGEGIGIPHGKMKDLKSLVVSFGLSRQGVDFESIDGRPAHIFFLLVTPENSTHIFFLLVTPENSTGLHLKLLARISRILKNDPFKERLLSAVDSDEIFSIIKDEDDEF
ncbi:MAG: PTS sugar transporter subunit IIA [Deltaproteobacteria bacterium]|nr:PTS sugar transporter subunit IIA [Deltaproteobacteria bacterium]